MDGVIVVYEQRRAAHALRRFHALVSRTSPDALVVAVRNRPELVLPPGPWHVVESDNRAAEFSGWDDGLRYLKGTVPRRGDDSSMVVLANDTWCVHRPFSLRDEEAFVGAFSVLDETPAIVGHRNVTLRPFRLVGARLRTWVSTFLFGLTPSALERLDWRVSLAADALESLVPGGATIETFFGAGLDPVLRAHLTRWLLRPGPGPRWYAATTLTPASAPRLASKARSIVNEKALSASVHGFGGVVRGVPGGLERRIRYRLAGLAPARPDAGPWRPPS